MHCPYCGFEIAARDAKFCGGCGKALGITCPCGFVNPPGHRYCGGCGTALIATEPPPAAALQPTSSYTTAPQPERRQIAIMYCDLVGSTALSRRVDAEDLREIVDHCFALWTKEIERVEGCVARLLGDGLLAYFGYPNAHEDDAVRAVSAGLAVLDATAQVSEAVEKRLGPTIEVHIGIATGEVVIGELGEHAARESAVTGEAPNIAARIRDAAGPGEVLIGRVTHDLVDHVFDCEPGREIAAKGIEEPLTVFRVIGERRDWRHAALFQTRSGSPLLGRAEELAFLSKQWDGVQDGPGRAQLISGDPGIGKSRLLHAFLTGIAEAGGTTLVTHCMPQFSNTALYPVTDLLQRELRLNPADARAGLRKLEQAFATRALGDPDALPLLASLMSLAAPDTPKPDLTPRQQRDRLLECLLAWLLAEASARPLALIVEDLHWADASTLELITMIVDQLPSVPMLLLATFRPGFAPPWSNRSLVNHMTLTRLSGADARELVRHLVQRRELPPQLLDQVIARTDGVPLFLEELTKMVVEAGTLAQQQAVEALPTGSIPATLRGSLVARLDRLGPAKAVAQLAAVIGREFSYRLVQTVSQLGEAELKEALRGLVDAELLYQRGAAPNASYSFKHALIQDAAYQSLLRTKRAEYHRATASALIDGFPEIVRAHPELAAQHCEQGGLVEQAIRYWQQAGKRALDASADTEAVAHLQRALSQIAALPPGADRAGREAECLLSLGPALSATRGYASTEVEQTYDRAVALCEESGDEGGLFTALSGLASFYQVRGPLATARGLSQRLLDLAQRRDDRVWLSQAHRRLGWCLFCQGELAGGRRHLAQALALAQQLPAHEHARVHGAHPWVIGAVNSALVEWYAGAPDDAIEHSRASLREARALGWPLTLAYALCMSAAVHQCRGEREPTLALATEVVALAHEHDFPYWIAWGSVLEGWALAAGGALEDGVAKMQAGLDMYRDTGALLFVPSSLALLGETYSRAGRTKEALDCTLRALESPQLGDGYFCAAEIHRLKGELVLARDADEAAAAACFSEALAIAKRQGAQSLALRSAVSLAELRQRQGRHDECRGLVQDALSGFDQGLETPDVKNAMRLLALR
ncbi:MAG TPA: AAA family ATPase [Burkholderiales bacterium]|nr:AAA family ATPase [Burkholderiales bacterium]